MLDEHDDGNLFAIPDFYRRSQWLDDDDISEPSRHFFSLDVKGLEEPAVFRASNVENKDFFSLPTRSDPDEINRPLGPDPQKDEVVVAPEQGNKDEVEQVEVLEDLWLYLGKPTDTPPTHLTWDSFNGAETESSKPTFITEAGPGAFDALISIEEDALNTNPTGYSTVDANVYCGSLLSMALGRESLLFNWHHDAMTFKPALARLRIPGYSGPVLEGVVDTCVRCGTAFRALRSFVDATYARHPTPCRVALASALDQTLLVIQSSVANGGTQMRSILQLQSVVRRISVLVFQLSALTTGLRHTDKDEDVLSLVFQQSQLAEDNNDIGIRTVMREVLQRVARPWMNLVEEWIGTRPEAGVPLRKDEEGRRKGFIKVEAEVFVDDHGDEDRILDFRLDPRRIPTFMPDDIIQPLFETGRNLRFIRSNHPEHLLARSHPVTKPPSIRWLFDWDSIYDLDRQVCSYEAALTAAVTSSSIAPLKDIKSPTTGSSTDDRYQLKLFGVDEPELQGRLQESMEALSIKLDQPRNDVSEDSLAEAVTSFVSSKKAHSDHLGTDFTPHWSLLPVLSLGSVISSQARVVGRESLKLLFAAHDLRENLRVHKEFHLCRNGLFCSRLSHALFDPDLETAERQAGVARRGGVMGLRLNGRNTWPPASSELRLALMGLLSDTYDGDRCSRSRHRSDGQPGQLPGDLSFGVRDLSSEEVDRIMDPDGLEALDFLRLSYKTPPALTSIITPVLLSRYDRAFKLLLRVLRMLYIVNCLFRDVTARDAGGEGPGDGPSDPAIRFCFEARHFVYSLSSYLFEVGVEMPWQDFEAKLDEIEADLHKDHDAGVTPGTAPSPERLREYHSKVLDRILSALMLRRRQQPVLKLLDDIFRVILRFAKYSRLRANGTAGDAEDGLTAAKLYKQFKKNVEVFLAVCRAMVEKGGSRSRGGESEGKGDGVAEESPFAQLLVKLDMSNYYLKA